MGYTNKTSHYDLPQWIAGDKPSWLGDMNTAMLNIDTAIASADASASAAESSAAAANAQVQAQEAKITKNTTDIQALTENLADTRGEVNNVKTVAEGALPKNGGTMSGSLILNGAPTSDLQAATKKYVDDNSGKGALMLSGGTMTGPLTLSGAPTADLMAATKKYVDDSAVTPISLPATAAGQTAGFNITACIIEGTLFVNGVGAPASSISANTNLVECDGNPLGITVNSGVNIGQYMLIYGTTGPTLEVGGVYVKYNGTTTGVYLSETIQAQRGLIINVSKVV